LSGVGLKKRNKTLSVTKWKPIIINVNSTRIVRFGQLDSIIPLISRKVLTEQLKELEEDGLLERLAYKELPPTVEYKLSEKGLAFCQF
jgi:DNA-binding HxlR family transcriptional regulator